MCRDGLHAVKKMSKHLQDRAKLQTTTTVASGLTQCDGVGKTGGDGLHGVKEPPKHLQDHTQLQPTATGTPGLHQCHRVQMGGEGLHAVKELPKHLQDRTKLQTADSVTSGLRQVRGELQQCDRMTFAGMVCRYSPQGQCVCSASHVRGLL